jgi:hypothetical protein
MRHASAKMRFAEPHSLAIVSRFLRGRQRG